MNVATKAVRVGAGIVALTLAATGCVVPKAGPNLAVETLPSSASAEERAAIEQLYSKDKTVRSQAALTLGMLRSEKAIPFLVSMLDDDHGRVPGKNQPKGFGAAMAAGIIGEDLGLAASEIGGHPGAFAAEGLSIIGPAAVKPLIQSLSWTHEQGIVTDVHRRHAVWALGELRDTSAVEDLMRHMGLTLAPRILCTTDAETLKKRIPETETRVSATRIEFWSIMAQAGVLSALAKIRDPRPTESLVGLLVISKDDYNRMLAARALKDITKRDFGKDDRAWLAWWKENNCG